MIEVFSTNSISGKQLHVKATITLDRRMNVGDAVYHIKTNMARQIAEKILEDKKFFWSGTEDIMGVRTFLNYGADCILLTTDELEIMKKESFANGMRHTNNFLPPSMGSY